MASAKITLLIQTSKLEGETVKADLAVWKRDTVETLNVTKVQSYEFSGLEWKKENPFPGNICQLECKF